MEKRNGYYEDVSRCDVCHYVDDDDTPKFVRYCRACKAWICAKCQPKTGRRAWAGMVRAWRGE